MAYKNKSQRQQAALRRPTPRRYGNFPDEILTDQEYMDVLSKKLRKIDARICLLSKDCIERKELGTLKRKLADELGGLRSVLKLHKPQNFNKKFIKAAKRLLPIDIYNEVFKAATVDYENQK